MAVKPKTKSSPTQPKDLLKEELISLYNELKPIKAKIEAGLLDRIISRDLKNLDTSKVDKLMKDQHES